MVTCMHWTPTYEFTDATVTRVCSDCGARGTRPRCSAFVKRTGDRCRNWVTDIRVREGTCRVHASGGDARPSGPRMIPVAISG